MPAEEDRKKEGRERTKHGSSRRRKHGSSRRDHKRHGEKRPGPIVSLAKRFWFELTALGLLFLGVFFLVERLQIKTIIWRTLADWAGVVGGAAGNLWGRTVAVFESAEKSDLVGIALVLFAVAMIALRMRSRAILRHSSPPLEKECPQCHKELHRLRRRLIDRLAEFFLRVRIKRYACSKCSFRTSVWTTRGESE